jgi:hypothetical protein
VAESAFLQIHAVDVRVRQVGLPVAFRAAAC